MEPSELATQDELEGQKGKIVYVIDGQYLMPGILRAFEPASCKAFQTSPDPQIKLGAPAALVQFATLPSEEERRSVWFDRSNVYVNYVEANERYLAARQRPPERRSFLENLTPRQALQ